MALRTPTRPAPTTPPRGGIGGKLIVALLVVVAFGIGITQLVPHLPGNDPQPSSPPVLPASAFDGYRDFYDENGATLPADLSVSQVTTWANACVGGTMPPNTPDFLPTDDILRARAGWICLVGAPVAVTPPDYCNAPGTGEGGARLTVERGHLVATRLGAHGNVRDDRGGCMNITPIDRVTNTRMRDGLEKEARTRATSGEIVFYLSVPVYFETRVTPSAVYLFVIGPAGSSVAPYDNPKHLWEGGDSAR